MPKTQIQGIIDEGVGSKNGLYELIACFYDGKPKATLTVDLYLLSGTHIGSYRYLKRVEFSAKFDPFFDRYGILGHPR